MKFNPIISVGVVLFIAGVASAAAPAEKLSSTGPSKAKILYDYTPKIIPRDDKVKKDDTAAAITALGKAPEKPVSETQFKESSADIMDLLKDGGLNSTTIEELQKKTRPPTYMIDAILKYLQPEEISKLRAAFGPKTGNASLIYLEAHMNSWEKMLTNTDMTLSAFAKTKARILAEKEEASDQSSPFYDPSYASYLDQVKGVVDKALESVLEDVKNLSDQAKDAGAMTPEEFKAIQDADPSNLDENTMGMFDEVLDAADKQRQQMAINQDEGVAAQGDEDLDPEEFASFLQSLKPEEKNALLGIKTLLDQVTTGPAAAALGGDSEEDHVADVPVEDDDSPAPAEASPAAADASAAPALLEALTKNK